MTSIEIANGLAHEKADILARRVRILAAARRSVREASFAVEKRVKGDMPVRWGRARTSWGHWTPGDLVDAKKANASPSDAIWKEDPDGLSITQGSNVPYIDRLNEGHSRQAPAGFLDAAEEKGMDVLNDRITKLMELF
jgi:hypothetical protein